MSVGSEADYAVWVGRNSCVVEYLYDNQLGCLPPLTPPLPLPVSGDNVSQCSNGLLDMTVSKEQFNNLLTI